MNSNVHNGIPFVAQLTKQKLSTGRYANIFTIESQFASSESEREWELISGVILTNEGSVDPTQILSRGQYERVTYEIQSKRYRKDEATRLIEAQPTVEWAVKADYVLPKVALDLWSLYVAIYVHVEKLETEFLDQMKPSFNLIQLYSIIAPGAFTFTPNYNTLYCEFTTEEQKEPRYDVAERIAYRLGVEDGDFECHKPLMFVNGRKFSDQTAYTFFPNVRGSIPGNIYLMTSFLGTAVLYFVYVATLTGRYLLQFVLRKEGPIAKLLQRNALGLMGLMIGVVLSVLRGLL